jgi:hypothetical protein
MVYNLGAAHYLGLHKKNEHQWQLLRDRLVPRRATCCRRLDTYPKAEPAPAPGCRRAPPPRAARTMKRRSAAGATQPRRRRQDLARSGSRRGG